MRVTTCAVRAALGLADFRRLAGFAEGVDDRALAQGLRGQLLSLPWAEDGADITELSVFTDGSAALSAGWPSCVASAGWAVVCFAPLALPGGGVAMKLVGAAFAPQEPRCAEPGFVGAVRPSAPTAEITAILVFLRLLVTRMNGPGLSVTLRSDCTYALDVPRCRARASSNVGLAAAARAA